MKLSKLLLGSQDIENTLNFYTQVLDATLQNSLENEEEARFELSFDEDSKFSLEFINNKRIEKVIPYTEEPRDTYWKYSLFVNDIQHVYDVVKKERKVGEPFQFGNIGYLSHTEDVENYKIEFIQKDFKVNTKEYPKTEALSLGEKAVFGLITLRTKDPVQSIRFYEKYFNLQLLVRMRVDRGSGFTLFFLGDKSLVPPSTDIDAIENREWMYHQKEAFIELQWHWDSEQLTNFEYNAKIDEAMGFKGIVFATENLDAKKKELQNGSVNFVQTVDELSGNEQITILSPDRHPIYIIEKE